MKGALSLIFFLASCSVGFSFLSTKSCSTAFSVVSGRQRHAVLYASDEAVSPEAETNENVASESETQEESLEDMKKQISELEVKSKLFEPFIFGNITF